MSITIEPLTVGPIVGHTDANSVRLWGRADSDAIEVGQYGQCIGVVRIKHEEGGRYENPRFFKMNPNFDFTGVQGFTDLLPDLNYNFQMGWFCSKGGWNDLPDEGQLNWGDASSGGFKTQSNDPSASREFVFGSCRYLLRLFGGNWFDSRGDKTFRSILRQIDDGNNIDLLLMIGDQIYADDLAFLYPDESIEKYLERYQVAFSQPYIRRLMGSTPTYMTLDDHEIEDNWPQKSSERDMMVKYPAAIHAYQTYQMSHSPLIPMNNEGRLTGTPAHFYYTFSNGCCDFFVTDTRTERDENQIISNTQMGVLLTWLGNGSSRVKIIVTSVPFFPDLVSESAKEDKWSGFINQRDRIIDYIRNNDIQKVIFLSGDVHSSMSGEIRINSKGMKVRKVLSIISSSFFWPYPHPKRRFFEMDGNVKSDSTSGGYPLENTSKVVSDDNFTRLKVSQEQVMVTVYSRKGVLLDQSTYEL